MCEMIRGDVVGVVSTVRHMILPREEPPQKVSLQHVQAKDASSINIPYLDEVRTGSNLKVNCRAVWKLGAGFIKVPRKEYPSAPSIERQFLVPFGGNLAQQMEIAWGSTMEHKT